MTLIYRAIWNDPDHNAPAVLDDEFTRWCIEKGFPQDDMPTRGELVMADKSIDIRRGDAESGRVLRATLRERDAAAGRTWTTTATAMFAQAVSTYWVDVECDHAPNDRVPIAAPRLVRNILLFEHGSPHRGPVPLGNDHTLTASVEDGESLAELVRNPSRDIPVAVFSWDRSASQWTNEQRAAAAAQTLAGICAVYLLEPAAVDGFNDGIGDGFKVYGGAARLYLPTVSPSDSTDAARHRWFPVHAFDRSTRRAGQLIAARISLLQRWPDPPTEWEHLRTLVFRPTEQQIAERVAVLAEQRNVDIGNLDALAAEVALLRELLVVGDAERDALSAETGAELSRLRATVEQLQMEHIDDIAELEDRDLLIASLQRNMRALSHGGNEKAPDADGELPDPDPSDLVPSTAIKYARERLSHIEVHPEAEQCVDELDEAYKALPWGSATWRGLRALQTYAEDVLAGSDAGNFKTWCSRTGAYSERKVAYSESVSVKSGDMAGRRVLPVSTQIDPSGRMSMLWHLKIQEGGGPNIPRLYFHDDTRGVTKKIHVGFYGPHRLMPNTKTN